jgi:DNA (cytosine-5)-methyltransferase 1
MGGNSLESDYSQADFLASLSVVPGSEEARKMTATSGRKCCALLKSQGPIGLLAKTLLESSIWNSTVVFLTWKLRATLSKRLLFQLAPSMPSIGETEFGLSARERNPEDHLWSTPCAKSGGTTRKDFGISLTEQARLFPTPRANDAEKRGNIAIDVRNGLLAAVKMWPTPKAILRGGCMSEMKRRSPDLHALVKMFPTPNASDNRNRGSLNNPSIQRRIAIGKQIGLTMQVGGQLNPTWVEWLMGYPIGHTELGHSETQSFRKSHIRSSNPSTKSKVMHNEPVE